MVSFETAKKLHMTDFTMKALLKHQQGGLNANNVPL